MEVSFWKIGLYTAWLVQGIVGSTECRALLRECVALISDYRVSLGTRKGSFVEYGSFERIFCCYGRLQGFCGYKEGLFWLNDELFGENIGVSW